MGLFLKIKLSFKFSRLFVASNNKIETKFPLLVLMAELNSFPKFDVARIRNTSYF